MGEEGYTCISVGCLIVWVQPTCIVKVHSWAYSKSLQCKFFHLMRSDQSMERPDFSMRSVPKSAFGLMQKLSKCVRHAEEKRRKRKKQRPFGLVWWVKAEQRAEAQKVSAIFVWVPEWTSNTKERASVERCSPKNREKHSESVRVKKKKEIFFFAQVTHKEDKLVEFSWRFWVLQPWRVEYSEEDFTTGFVVRLYLPFEIYLLYI